MEYEVPIWEKSYLTLGEASAYTGIGERKLRELCSREDCEFILWVGEKKYWTSTWIQSTRYRRNKNEI